MKIAVDGGALSGGKTYGTYRVTEQLLQALNRYDTSNTYDVFTLPSPSFPGQIKDNKNMRFIPVTPSIAWMHGAVPWTLHDGNYELFVAVNQALPSWWRGPIITLSHGLSFLKYPELYTEDFPRLKMQLDLYVKRSERILVSSERVRNELIEYAPAVEDRVTALPFGLPYQLSLVRGSIPRKPFLLYVGSNQPIKQVEKLVGVFRKIYQPGFQLFLAGVPKSESIITEAGNAAQGLIFIPQASLDQLRVLYRTAAATVSCSRYESFGYPLVEASMMRCPVIALESAVIPELAPFVTSVSNEKEMAEACQAALNACTDSPVSAKDLESIFSWEQFVRKGIIDYADNRSRPREE